MGMSRIVNFPAEAWDKRLPNGCLVDRDETIIDLCKNRRVLHLGASDSPFYKEKASRNELLHQKIRKVALSTVGIDADAESVVWLRDQFNIDDILVADLSRQTPVEIGGPFDIVLCCDIIEHVDNAQNLLNTCKFYMHEDTDLLMTTINATSLKPAIRAIFGREAVHHEHTCYYSYSTLCQLLIRKGFVPEYFGAFSYPTVTPWARSFFGTIARFAPGTADGIMISAKCRG